MSKYNFMYTLHNKKEAFLILLKVVEDLNKLLRSWWTWNKSFFFLKRIFCLGLKWMLKSLLFFPPLSAFMSSIDGGEKSG